MTAYRNTYTQREGLGVGGIVRTVERETRAHTHTHARTHKCMQRDGFCTLWSQRLS